MANNSDTMTSLSYNANCCLISISELIKHNQTVYSKSASTFCKGKSKGKGKSKSKGKSKGKGKGKGKGQPKPKKVVVAQPETVAKEKPVFKALPTGENQWTKPIDSVPAESEIAESVPTTVETTESSTAALTPLPTEFPPLH